MTAWIDDTDEELLFLSVLTLVEIGKGVVVLLPRNARRTSLEAWLSKELPLRFSNRILGVDREVADRWGHLSGLTSARGVHLGVIDGLLAATAMLIPCRKREREKRDELNLLQWVWCYGVAGLTRGTAGSSLAPVPG